VNECEVVKHVAMLLKFFGQVHFFFLFTASIVSSGWFLNRLFCAEVPFMINLKTPGTIYDTFENTRYHL
jgi:hypothetical protein